MAPVSSETVGLSIPDASGQLHPSDPDDAMQEVIPFLWLGEYTAASDMEALQRHGIKYVISAIRWKPVVVQGITYLHVEVDDTPDANLLEHLPACMTFIDKAIESGAGVLVHCQAGVSRSATIVVAYLMYKQKVESVDALTVVRNVRPQASPSDTFLHQLQLFYDVSFKVSKKDKATRRFYLSRTAEEVMNGDGSAPPMEMLASWPITPSSTPSTPIEKPKRRIRCKKCRRELATREHMLDHNVGSATRPNTPGLGGVDGDPMQMTSLSHPGSRAPSQPPSRAGSRRSSNTAGEAARPTMSPLEAATASAAAAAGAGSTGAVPPRRRSSASSPLAQELPVPADVVSAAPPLSTPTIPEEGPVPVPEAAAGTGLVARPPVRKPSVRRTVGTTAVVPGPALGAVAGTVSDSAIPRLSSLAMTALPSPPLSTAVDHSDSAVSEDDDPPLPPRPSASPLSSGTLLSGSALNSSLPPALAALRSASSGPTLGPTATTSTSSRKPSFTAGLQMSRLDSGSGSGTGSNKVDETVAGSGFPLPAIARVADRAPSYFSPPILANPNCSGYFLEPMKWMESFLEAGDLGGAIVCPNKKCNAKLGSYDWAGVRCGCKEWIVPGFCIHKSKVDEDL